MEIACNYVANSSVWRFMRKFEDSSRFMNSQRADSAAAYLGCLIKELFSFHCRLECLCSLMLHFHTLITISRGIPIGCRLTSDECAQIHKEPWILSVDVYCDKDCFETSVADEHSPWLIFHQIRGKEFKTHSWDDDSVRGLLWVYWINSECLEGGKKELRIF